MFARKLQPGEYWQARRIMAVAFEATFGQGREVEREKTSSRTDTGRIVDGSFSFGRQGYDMCHCGWDGFSFADDIPQQWLSYMEHLEDSEFFKEG